MKHCKKLTLLLIAALLLAAALMTGCTGLTPAQDAPADTKKEGIYVRLERDDAYAVYLNSDSFTKVCENADGTPLKSGEWIFAGEDIAKLSQEENRSVLFTVGASGADDTLLEEASFFYDIAKGTLYVTVGAEGVTCSTSGEPDAMADVPPVLKLAILDEIDETVMVGVSGSSLRAVQAAVQAPVRTPPGAASLSSPSRPLCRPPACGKQARPGRLSSEKHTVPRPFAGGLRLFNRI